MTLCSWMLAAALAQDASGLRSDVTFIASSPLAGNAEMVRRLFSPLTAQHIVQSLAQSGKTLSGQPLDPSRETFTLYVPAQKPVKGYALIVFVPPWNEAKLPSGWATVLDQTGAIFVTAAHSGNDANVIARRVPLALLAAQNAMQRYIIDPEHVFVAGFSGGARVALRLALGYPDLFRGALLQAGSDLIGTADMPLPPRDLFVRFQEGSYIVYMTGEDDSAALNADTASKASLHKLCVFGVQSRNIPAVAHSIADGAAFARGLNALLNPPAADTGTTASCQTALTADVDAGLAEIETQLKDGRRDEAKKSLKALDAHYGGLAAPQSLGLLNELQ
jgi:dienelactone hydrolase